MNKILNTILILGAAVSIASCTLKLQKNEKYEGKALDPHENVTAWEFMQKHSDIFSNMMKAVETCGLKDYYTQTSKTYTYIVFSEEEMAKSIANIQANPSEIPLLKDTLLFHIVDGDYHGYGTLSFMPVDVTTLLGPDYRMTMALTGPNTNTYQTIYNNKNYIIFIIIFFPRSK